MSETPSRRPETDPTPGVNEEIRVAMVRRNIKPAELAARVGLTYQALYRRMTGDVSWDLSELGRVAAALETTVRELVSVEVSQ